MSGQKEEKLLEKIQINNYHLHFLPGFSSYLLPYQL